MDQSHPLNPTSIASLSILFLPIRLLIKDLWKSAMCFGFVLLHITFTQLYLCTNKGQKLLLENISKQTEVSLVPTLRKKWKVNKQELTSIKWTFLAICLVSSIVMIFSLQMKLLQGKRDTMISRQFFSVNNKI